MVCSDVFRFSAKQYSGIARSARSSGLWHVLNACRRTVVLKLIVERVLRKNNADT